MIADSTMVLGIIIPSRDPLFLGILAIHVAAGLLCVIAGATAIASVKGPGRHTRFGDIYFRSLAVVATTMAALAAMRWREDYHLFLIGCLSFACALAARRSIRHSGPSRIRIHIAGMASSYVLLLVAFYVDNGPNLPLWKQLPVTLYWLLPIAVGGPLIARAVLRHPLARAERQANRP
jgi:uncharacterized membrane protein